MKIKSQTIRIAFWILLGVAISITSLALTRPLPGEATATPTVLTDDIVSAAEAIEDAGSTDGIMLVAVVIVLIVIIPILLKRGSWSNGKRK